MVAALDANGRVLTVSRIVHIATKGGKAGNYRKVTTKAKFKKIKLKKGKKLRLKVKTVADSKPRKVKKHVKVRFETTNPAVATVSKKGVIKAKGKGTCLVYAYAQNGVYLKVKVTVR